MQSLSMHGQVPEGNFDLVCPFDCITKSQPSLQEYLHILKGVLFR